MVYYYYCKELEFVDIFFGVENERSHELFLILPSFKNQHTWKWRRGTPDQAARDGKLKAQQVVVNWTTKMVGCAKRGN